MENNLSSALARAQANIGSAPKTGFNPHFKSSFSTLEDLISVSRKALTDEGISVSQYIESKEGIPHLVTLMLGGGTSIKSECPIFLKDPTDIQKLGSAISYIKRYMYASIVGIATSEMEDDGNGISQQQPTQSYATEKQVGYIKTLLKDREHYLVKILGSFNIERLEDLTSSQARAVIDKLKDESENK